MNIPDVLEAGEKLIRVRGFLDKNGFDAMIIGRQDNFSWFTCGGDSRVVTTSEEGFTVLVITQKNIYAVAYYMDGFRVIDEELAGLGAEPVIINWCDDTREGKAAKLVKGLKTISDIPVEGAVCKPADIYKLHYPLTDKEIEKCRLIGRMTDQIFKKVADDIKPGMTEYEVEAMLLYEYGRINAVPEVLLIGSDERIAKYRHPLPADKKIDRFVLLHSGLRKWGLHANVTRMVYFGDKLPDDIHEKYELASKLEAAAIAMCVPGEDFSKILDIRKKMLAEAGFGEEWKYHFPGGITGYLLCDANVCAKQGEKVVINQAYDWFITVTGVKVEELSINTLKGREVVSAAGNWPCKDYSYTGQTFKLPEILMR